MQATSATTVFVVGIGRNAGKTTALRALYGASHRRRIGTGLTSVGRDSEGRSGDVAPKRRLWFHPGTVFATARDALPHSPACRILKLSSISTAAGTLLYARCMTPGFYDLVGAPTASGLHEAVKELATRAELVIVDGAVDRIAALAGSEAAVIVACGAAGARTQDEAVDEAAGLVARLSVPRFDGGLPFVQVDGALTASGAAAFLAANESRQIVVRDPTQIALSGKAAREALNRLRIRCRRPLRVVAATIASIGPERSFEPASFRHAVAVATGLPAYDVFAGAGGAAA